MIDRSNSATSSPARDKAAGAIGSFFSRYLLQSAAVWLALIASAGICRASGSPDMVTVQSSSKQFLVYGLPPDPAGALLRRAEGNTDALTLEPSLVAISCERIKQAFLRQLDAPDNWMGQVHVIQRRSWSSEAACSLNANRFRDGWSYRLEIPETITPERLVRMITRVLLIEMANRDAGDRSAELPFWLAEGFPSFLELITDTELVVRPPKSQTDVLAFTPVVVQRQLLREELNVARSRFAQRPALSVQQLSWPEDHLRSGAAIELYRESALWFVYELLKMEDGRRLFRSFLGHLPRYHNWQTAFFKVHQSQMRTPLDLEKWWALRLATMKPLIAPLQVALDNSLALLDEVLRTPMQVRIESGDSPLRTDVKLQEALMELDDQRRLNLAREKLLRLQLAQARMAAPLLELARQYRDALAKYVVVQNEVLKAQKAPSKVSTRRADGPVSPRNLKPLEELNQTLNELDARRQALATPAVALHPAGTNGADL